MAQGWAGFSEEELKRLKHRQDPFEPQRRLPGKKTRQQLQREKALLEQSQKLGLQDEPASSPPGQLLSAPKPRSDPESPRSPPPALPRPAALTAPTGHGKMQGTEHRPGGAGLENSHGTHQNAEVLPAKPDCPSEKKVELQEKSRWEILQQEQRLMEEKNKRKKALLAKAIAERSRRTQAETVKLKRIQKELQAVDDLVSADIGILRNRIDQASLDYSCARKRFDRAEAEYVAAKLDLQRKTDTKEQLTEHLCTIIQQNELRKARRLEALMQQLEVHADEETLELEVEVERLLLAQEAEAGTLPAAPVERPCQPAGESAAWGLANENRKPPEQAVSPEGSGSIPCVSPDCPNGGGRDISAAQP